jgi:hypothetical protein
MHTRSRNIYYILFSPGNSGHANAPQCYVVHTLPVLFGRYFCVSITAKDLKPKQVRSLAKPFCMQYVLLSLYAFFWVIPRRLNFICRRFGTLCSETSAYKIQRPGNYPEESIQHSEQDENLKLRFTIVL